MQFYRKYRKPLIACVIPRSLVKSPIRGLWLNAVFPGPPQLPLNMNEEKRRSFARTMPFPRSVRNIEPECPARNKRRGSSIIHYHFPSIPYLGMLYNPRGIAPRNLSDGIDLRLDERKGNIALWIMDVRRVFSPRYFIHRRLTDVLMPRILHVDYKTSREFAWEIFKYKCEHVVRSLPFFPLPSRPRLFITFIFHEVLNKLHVIGIKLSKFTSALF